MNDILSGTYKGNTYRIKVECYPNTPAIKVQLLPVNAGERITMTQNLGQPLPRYQAFLCDGMLEVDSTAFMDYMEENDLGYIVDYAGISCRERFEPCAECLCLSYVRHGRSPAGCREEGTPHKRMVRREAAPSCGA